MRVKIGPYPNRMICNVFNDYMNKKYGYVTWPLTYTKFEKFLEKVDNSIQTVYDCSINLFLDRREQKISINIDAWDTWNMDCTLAYIIVPMLKQLKEKKHGAPNVDAKDVPIPLRPKKQDVLRYKELGETDDTFFERWEWVMDEMIWAFSEHVKNYTDAEGKFFTGDTDILSVPIDADGNEVAKEDAQYFRMERGPNDTSQFDKEGYEAWLARKENGFRLFGKYYQSLWD